ncbi:haloacid dehalogenase [Clostridia bacterium]|nr:haloacid dehalogenase [Clostridia bacterium]
MIFSPTYRKQSVLEITPQFLREEHISALILDVDNTLSYHDSQSAEAGVEDWILLMRQTGVRMILLSNNTESRVRPFAEHLGIPFISMGLKPVPFGIFRAVRLLKTVREENTAPLKLRQVCMVGDQLFTDVLCGKFAGVRTILTEPFHIEDDRLFRLKRRLENMLIR